MSGLAARLQNSGVSVIGVTFRSNGLALPALLVCNQLNYILRFKHPKRLKFTHWTRKEGLGGYEVASGACSEYHYYSTLKP